MVKRIPCPKRDFKFLLPFLDKDLDLWEFNKEPRSYEAIKEKDGYVLEILARSNGVSLEEVIKRQQKIEYYNYKHSKHDEEFVKPYGVDIDELRANLREHVLCCKNCFINYFINLAKDVSSGTAKFGVEFKETLLDFDKNYLGLLPD